VQTNSTNSDMTDNNSDTKDGLHQHSMLNAIVAIDPLYDLKID
jgi:trehalose/maltose hydrolase-like predicted phosphorylase